MIVRTRNSVLLAVASFAVPSTATAQLSRTITFAETPGPATITAEGVEVTLQPMASDDDTIDVSAAIRVPGFQSVIVNEGFGSSAFHERWVGIGKLSVSDPAPSVLLTGFTGGAHCCATLKAIVPVAGKLKTVEFEPIDGDGGDVFPRDIDQDGIADFERQDDSFRYQFASGAGSISPPMIYNIYKGQIIDVSAQPSFRSIWETFANETRAACADQSNDDRNGACAAYVAAGARLGRYQQTLAEAEKLASEKNDIMLPQACSVATGDNQCPPGKEIKFYTFGSALRWFLKDRSYID